jgi:hypothetical protein
LAASGAELYPPCRADADADRHLDGRNGDPDPDGNAERDTDAHRDGDPDPDGNAERDADAHRDGDADPDRNAERDTDTHRDGDADPCGNADRDADGDADADGNAERDADAHRDGDADPGGNALATRMTRKRTLTPERGSAYPALAHRGPLCSVRIGDVRDVRDRSSIRRSRRSEENLMRFFAHPPARFMAAATLLGAVIATAPCFAAGPLDATAKETAGPRENVEARIKTLHSQLRITSAQEPLWNDFAQAMREDAARMADLRKGKLENAKSMSAVDQLNAYASVVDAHADGVHKLIPPFQKLYDQMSDQQKKAADAVFRERARAAAQRHKR